VYKAAIYTHQYFDGNGLHKEHFHLDTVDRWDFYIKPIMYGKYWQDELIYFPKYGGWEDVPFMNNNPSKPELKLPAVSLYRKNAVLIPYFKFLEELSTAEVPLRYYQRPD
jgi:hypothetical protein